MGPSPGAASRRTVTEEPGATAQEKALVLCQRADREIAGTRERIEIVVICVKNHVGSRVRFRGDADVAPESAEIKQRLFHAGMIRRICTPSMLDIRDSQITNALCLSRKICS